MYLPWLLEYEQVSAVDESDPGYAREPVMEAEGRNEVNQQHSVLANSLDPTDFCGEQLPCNFGYYLGRLAIELLISMASLALLASTYCWR